MTIIDRRGLTVDGSPSPASSTDPSTHLAIKTPVRAATTANIVLSGLQTIDGVALSAGDRVLVKDQTDPVENGIWQASTGNWTRATDFDSPREVVDGTQVWVNQGNTNANLFFGVTAGDPIVPDTTSLAFAASTFFLADPSAEIGLTPNNGSAATAMRSDATPALSQAIAPTWTGKHVFTTTAGGIEFAGSANISKSYSGGIASFAFYQVATTVSNTLPEVGAHFGIVSTNGLANPVSAYKAGLAWDATAQAGSAGVWGAVGVVTLEAAASSTIYGIGLELDGNFKNAGYSANAAPYATNLLLTGTNNGAGTYGQAGLVMAYGGGADPLWNYGLLGVDYSTARAFRTAFISDQSRSPIIIHSNSAHTTGISFGSASFSGNAIETPGFILDSVGNINGAQGRFNGPVIPNTDDGFALGSTSLKWSDLFLAEGGVISWDNGDVTITQTNNVLAIAGITSLASDGALHVTDSTQSTSTSTGSGIFDGGLAVAKDIYGGGKISAAAAFYIGAAKFAENSGGTYSVIYDGGAAAAVALLGNASDPNNYWNQTTHTFRDRAGATNFATINSSGINMPLDRGILFTNQTSAAAGSAGTLTNAPAAGNPGHWLKIKVGGTNYAIPCWAG